MNDNIPNQDFATATRPIEPPEIHLQAIIKSSVEYLEKISPHLARKVLKEELEAVERRIKAKL